MSSLCWKMGRNRAYLNIRNSSEFDAGAAERSVEIMEDTKIPNAATIKIVKQDHTLGNMIRA